MLKIKEKLKNINIPINSGSLALFISLLAVGYVASAVQSPCIQAQATCAVGGDSEFSGNIGLKGGTTYVATEWTDLVTRGVAKGIVDPLGRDGRMHCDWA